MPRRPLLSLQTRTRRAWQIVNKSSAVTVSSQGGPGARLHSNFACPRPLRRIHSQLHEGNMFATHAFSKHCFPASCGCKHVIIRWILVG